MKRSELEYAARWNSDLKRAQEDAKNLQPFNVVGIMIDDGHGGLSPHRIERGASTGTGTISHIAWSEDLQKELTAALHRVFQNRIKEAETNLESVGVEIA